MAAREQNIQNIFGSYFLKDISVFAHSVVHTDQKKLKVQNYIRVAQVRNRSAKNTKVSAKLQEYSGDAWYKTIKCNIYIFI